MAGAATAATLMSKRQHGSRDDGDHVGPRAVRRIDEAIRQSNQLQLRHHEGSLNEGHHHGHVQRHGHEPSSHTPSPMHATESMSVRERMSRVFLAVLAAVRLQKQTGGSPLPSEARTAESNNLASVGRHERPLRPSLPGGAAMCNLDSEPSETGQTAGYPSFQSAANLRSNSMSVSNAMYSTRAFFDGVIDNDGAMNLDGDVAEGGPENDRSQMTSFWYESWYPRSFKDSALFESTPSLGTTAEFQLYDGSRCQVCLHRIMSTGFFDFVMGVAILANLACITSEQAHRLHGRDVSGYDLAENIFLSVYVVELLARFYVWGRSCLESNYVVLDSLIVLTGVVTNWVIKPIFGDVDGLGPLFILRIARLVRLIRALRLLIIFRELWMLVAGLLNALRTMLYTLFLLLIILYAFGSVGLELLANHALVKGDAADLDFKAIVDANFSDLPTAMLTLLQFVMFDNIVYIYKPLVTRDWSLLIFFVMVILVLGIVLMNLVTAVIVNSALEQAIQDKDLTKSIEQAKKKKLVKEMRRVFMRLDEDGSGEISRNEIQNISIADKEILQKLMGMNNPLEIFDALDVDGDEEIGIAEFVDGIWQVIISDTPIHVKRMEKQMAYLRQEIRETQDLCLEFQQKMDEKMEVLLGGGSKRIQTVPSIGAAKAGAASVPFLGAQSLPVTAMSSFPFNNATSLPSTLGLSANVQPALQRKDSLESSGMMWQARIESASTWNNRAGDSEPLSMPDSRPLVNQPAAPAQQNLNPNNFLSGRMSSSASQDPSSSSGAGQHWSHSAGLSGVPPWAQDMLFEIRATYNIAHKLLWREQAKMKRKLGANGIRTKPHGHHGSAAHSEVVSMEESSGAELDSFSHDAESVSWQPAAPPSPRTTQNSKATSRLHNGPRLKKTGSTSSVGAGAGTAADAGARGLHNMSARSSVASQQRPDTGHALSPQSATSPHEFPGFSSAPHNGREMSRHHRNEECDPGADAFRDRDRSVEAPATLKDVAHKHQRPVSSLPPLIERHSFELRDSDVGGTAPPTPPQQSSDTPFFAGSGSSSTMRSMLMSQLGSSASRSSALQKPADPEQHPSVEFAQPVIRLQTPEGTTYLACSSTSSGEPGTDSAARGKSAAL